MKIGVIPPVPMEPFVASTHQVTNLWSAFFLESERSPWLETARLAGFPENFSLWARCLYGIVCDRGLEAVFYPEPGTPKEVAKALKLLAGHGVKISPFSFPLFRNDQRLKGEFDRLSRELGVEAGLLVSILEQVQQVRTVLRRFDGLQQRSMAFPSKEYVGMLARSMDPRGNLEGLRRDIEKAILDYRDLGQDRWTRVGIIGLTPYRDGFYEALQQYRAVVVYDEWGVENNPMAATSDLNHLYHLCSLPYGLKRRQERILREAAVRKLRGIVLGVEYLCDSLREEGYFRANMEIPVHTVENRGDSALSSAEQNGLKRFLDSCARSA